VVVDIAGRSVCAGVAASYSELVKVGIDVLEKLIRVFCPDVKNCTIIH